MLGFVVIVLSTYIAFFGPTPINDNGISPNTIGLNRLLEGILKSLK